MHHVAGEEVAAVAEEVEHEGPIRENLVVVGGGLVVSDASLRFGDGVEGGGGEGVAEGWEEVAAAGGRTQTTAS